MGFTVVVVTTRMHSLMIWFRLRFLNKFQYVVSASSLLLRSHLSSAADSCVMPYLVAIVALRSFAFLSSVAVHLELPFTLGSAHFQLALYDVQFHGIRITTRSSSPAGRIVTRSSAILSIVAFLMLAWLHTDIAVIVGSHCCLSVTGLELFGTNVSRQQGFGLKHELNTQTPSEKRA
ncbi:hypothetical protein KC319_g52 [Hortaea werneckii]|nr:hypothetical protein KC319_g52 [Hortaea werneckii]